MDPEASPHDGDGVPARIVVFPEEVDISNAARLGAELRREMRHANHVVVADLTRTSFLDSSGVRYLVVAKREAQRQGVDFRVAVPSDFVRHVLKITGVDQVLAIYPDIRAALAGEMPPDEAGRESAS